MLGQASGVVSGLVGAVAGAMTSGTESDESDVSAAGNNSYAESPLSGAPRVAEKRPRTASSSKKAGATTKRASTSRPKKAGADRSSTEE
jgi:hypothetical protein